jgi:hypothetical protein
LQLEELRLPFQASFAAIWIGRCGSEWYVSYVDACMYLLCWGGGPPEGEGLLSWWRLIVVSRYPSAVPHDDCKPPFLTLLMQWRWGVSGRAELRGERGVRAGQ